ncbi:anti-sigma regulatory factor (Ser/Thr protein kinase) [Streptacidiphilus sp. MAP12-16]|uniref:ATP-binding protein n=1 Tax=Streptacidiphilus sp. MAP12-16 TaxID=3156300 RepID=UPI003511819E
MTVRTHRAQHRTLYAWGRSTDTPAADARQHLRCALTDLNVAPDELDDALVMASELVTNAHLHATGPYELRLRTTPVDIIVEVRDRSTAVPPPVEAPTGSLFAPRPEDRGAGIDALLAQLTERGRGLQIVHQLSRGCWGFCVHSGFKIAWYALALPRAAN